MKITSTAVFLVTAGRPAGCSLEVLCKKNSLAKAVIKGAPTGVKETPGGLESLLKESPDNNVISVKVSKRDSAAIPTSADKT